MGILKQVQKYIYRRIKIYRRNFIINILNNKSKTLLDIGCQDMVFYNELKGKYKITLADYFPTSSLIKKEDVQKLSFKNNSFDIVLCQEVLEHVPDPVKAISELKRVARKQIIISVPYEPFFTLYRFLFWEKEHLWAIRPELFKIHLGNPTYEKKIFLKRYYVGVWVLKK